MLFEVTKNDKVFKYDLKFSMKRVELIENYLNETSLLSIFIDNKIPSIKQMKAIIGYGLINEDGNHVSIEQGAEIAEVLIMTYGIAKVTELAIGGLYRDCSFLFQEG